jgi:hypothetical protein
MVGLNQTSEYWSRRYSAPLDLTVPPYYAVSGSAISENKSLSPETSIAVDSRLHIKTPVWGLMFDFELSADAIELRAKLP